MAMTPKEQLDIIAAHIAGEEIQCAGDWDINWKKAKICCVLHQFDFRNFKYRKKPKPLELWINLYPEPRSSVPHAVYTSEDDAIRFRGDNGRTVHMREVVDEDS